MLPNLRKCKDLSEFIGHLKGERDNHSEFLIWKSIENVRELARAVIEDVRVVKNQNLIGARLSQPISIQSGEQLYFYQEASATLFKAFVTESNGRQIQLKISGWPFLAEKRDKPRFEFIDVQYFLEVQTYFQNLDKLIKHQVVMRNISMNGLAFTITAGRAQKFQVGDKIFLNKVEKIEMPTPVAGKIAHVTPLKRAVSDGEVAEFSKQVLVGVAFDEPNLIIEKVLKVL